MKRRSSILPNVREQISTALQEGDVSKLHALTLEGYGKGLVGRSVWTDKARKYLKRLPQILESIRDFHSAILNGDVKKVESSLESDPSLIKAKDEYGLMAIHLAALRNQPEIVFYITNKFPNSIHLKDNVSLMIKLLNTLSKLIWFFLTVWKNSAAYSCSKKSYRHVP